MAEEERTEILLGQQLVPLEYGAPVDHGLLFEGLDLAGGWAGGPGGCADIVGDGVVGDGGRTRVAWIGAHDEEGEEV